ATRRTERIFFPRCSGGFFPAVIIRLHFVVCNTPILDGPAVRNFVFSISLYSFTPDFIIIRQPSIRCPGPVHTSTTCLCSYHHFITRSYWKCCFIHCIS